MLRFDRFEVSSLMLSRTPELSGKSCLLFFSIMLLQLIVSRIDRFSRSESGYFAGRLSWAMTSGENLEKVVQQSSFFCADSLRWSGLQPSSGASRLELARGPSLSMMLLWWTKPRGDSAIDERESDSISQDSVFLMTNLRGSKESKSLTSSSASLALGDQAGGCSEGVSACLSASQSSETYSTTEELWERSPSDCSLCFWEMREISCSFSLLDSSLIRFSDSIFSRLAEAFISCAVTVTDCSSCCSSCCSSGCSSSSICSLSSQSLSGRGSLRVHLGMAEQCCVFLNESLDWMTYSRPSSDLREDSFSNSRKGLSSSCSEPFLECSEISVALIISALSVWLREGSLPLPFSWGRLLFSDLLSMRDSMSACRFVFPR